jgi:hypothetical protein
MAGRMEPAALCITSIARKQFAMLPPASILRIRARRCRGNLLKFIALDLTLHRKARPLGIIHPFLPSTPLPPRPAACRSTR